MFAAIGDLLALDDIRRSRTISGLVYLSEMLAKIVQSSLRTTWRSYRDLGIENVFAAIQVSGYSQKTLQARMILPHICILDFSETVSLNSH